MGKVKVEYNIGPGLGAVIEAVKKRVQQSEPCRHLVAAGKETLLAVRALLDAKIRVLEELSSPPSEQPEESGETEGRKVEVE